MAEQINWDEIEAAFSFKPIENGNYTAKVLNIEVADTPSMNGNYPINIELDKLDGKTFPFFSTHWISFKNGNWRIYHMKSLFMDLGVAEAKAKSKVQECELAGNNEDIATAYRNAFKAWATTHPSVKVVVETQPYKHKDKESSAEEIRLNGHRTEFAGESYMPPQTLKSLQKRYPDVPVRRDNDSLEASSAESADDISLDEIPF